MTPAADSQDTARREDAAQSPRARALLASAQRLHDVVQPDTPPMIFPLEPGADAT